MQLLLRLLDAHRELVAHNRTPEEVAAHIGADWVVYQSISDLEDSVRKLNPALEAFDTSCFSGTYVTGDIDAAYLARLMRTTMDDKPDKPAPTTGAPPKRPRIAADGPRAAECSRRLRQKRRAGGRRRTGSRQRRGGMRPPRRRRRCAAGRPTRLVVGRRRRPRDTPPLTGSSGCG